MTLNELFKIANEEQIEMLNTYSDLVKDCYGTRSLARHAEFENMDQFVQEYMHLATVILPEVMAEEEREAYSLSEFEKEIELVRSTISTYHLLKMLLKLLPMLRVKTHGILNFMVENLLNIPKESNLALSRKC